jgi:hypothetical protein
MELAAPTPFGALIRFEFGAARKPADKLVKRIG